MARIEQGEYIYYLCPCSDQCSISDAIIQIHIALEHNQSQYLNSAATDYVMFICCFEHIFNSWLDF